MKLSLIDFGSAISQRLISLQSKFIQRGLPRCSFCSWILPALVLAFPIAVRAQNTVGVPYTYTITNGTVTITQYTGPGGAVSIPAVIAGLPVTSIGPQAFGYSVSLTNVTIPNSVTNIGIGAFTDCTKLTGVTIGNSVISIGDQAFVNCTSLGHVTIPNSVTTIGFEAFYDCTSLTSVMVPNSVISIGSDSFGWCTKLTSVTIPSSVSSIGDSAFESCSSLSAITVDALNPSYSSLAGVLFNKNQTMLIQCPGAKAGTYAVPNGITSIGSAAFLNCNSLNTVTLPNSVTNIGASAFSSCSSLSVITVDALNPFYSSPDGDLFDKTQSTLIQHPGARAGVYAVPSSVTNIVSTAFTGCASLTAITVDVLNLSYSSLAGVLFDKTQTTLIQCPAGLTGTCAIPASVTRIGDYAFISCTGLTSVTIPDSVTAIGAGAFVGCNSLTNVVIPDSVTSIGSKAFEGCTSLTGVTIGNSVSSIGIGAFAQCSSLRSVTIPNSVTSIVDRTFSGCTSLTSVTIGNSVTNIGSLAFGFCTNLSNVYFQGNAPTVDLAALGDDNATIYYLSGRTGWGTTFDGLPTVTWNPRVQTDARFGVRTNQFGFNISGASNLVIVVEACANLASPIWTPLQTNVLNGGSAYFSDPQWTNYPVRFYRIRSP
jgi:hypothetical protein